MWMPDCQGHSNTCSSSSRLHLSSVFPISLSHSYWRLMPQAWCNSCTGTALRWICTPNCICKSFPQEARVELWNHRVGGFGQLGSWAVYTDHGPLESLLNTPQPSGKLARWGMAIQELDLTIVHWSGKHNNNADALSRYPLPTTVDEHPSAQVVAAITATEEAGAQDDLGVFQGRDEELSPIINFHR